LLAASWTEYPLVSLPVESLKHVSPTNAEFPSLPSFFFLEHAGELRIFVLRRREWPIYITDHPPWARMGDG